MAKVNFTQVMPQSFENRVQMYMKSKKLELATMLAEQDKILHPNACAELNDGTSISQGSRAYLGDGAIMMCGLSGYTSTSTEDK